uniref:30S ribosomal protein S3 n=1 Tax=Cavernulicola chilensis TaxID=3028028 RepID=A0A7H0WB75_9RHOD|nr:30S ribosomal protein S3 [Cavernulicola chilensis]QNR39804.1 30S ribosomal protein S3 [Cavernulicola chilensis]
MGQKANTNALRRGSLFTWEDTWYSANYPELSHDNIKIREYLRRMMHAHSCVLGECRISVHTEEVHIYISFLRISDSTKVSAQAYGKVSRQARTCGEPGSPPWGEIQRILQSRLEIPIELDYREDVEVFSNVNFLAGTLRYGIEAGGSAQLVMQELRGYFEEVRERGCPFVLADAYGAGYYYLKGIKITCLGRLSGSQNAMASKESEFVGLIPTNFQRGHIRYSTQQAYTIRGTCGIKVWLFYKRKS